MDDIEPLSTKECRQQFLRVKEKKTNSCWGDEEKKCRRAEMVAVSKKTGSQCPDGELYRRTLGVRNGRTPRSVKEEGPYALAGSTSTFHNLLPRKSPAPYQRKKKIRRHILVRGDLLSENGQRDLAKYGKAMVFRNLGKKTHAFSSLERRGVGKINSDREIAKELFTSGPLLR